MLEWGSHLLLPLCGEVLSDAEESIEGGAAAANVVPWVVNCQENRVRAQQTFALTNMQLCIKFKITETMCNSSREL